MMIILVQGGGLRPRSSSGQWVGAVWWLYTFFAIATYTANMGAFLTISRMVKDIDSFEYLQKQNRMRQQSNICYICVYLINVSLVSLPSMGLNI